MEGDLHGIEREFDGTVDLANLNGKESSATDLTQTFSDPSRDRPTANAYTLTT